MKQKIVIKVEMACEKCKKKVMQIAANTSGVKSMELVGEISDGKIMVTGEDVDSVSLTRSLRKKLGRATLESVEQVKPPEKKVEPEVPTPPKVDPYTFYPPYYPYTFYVPY